MSLAQSMFTKDGIKPTRTDLTNRQLRKYAKADLKREKFANTRAVCPFCGHMSTKNKFMTITKAQLLSKMFTCPICKERMHGETLDVFDKGPLAYSQWFWSIFYEYDRSRLNVEQVKVLVKDFDFGDVFWETWKEYKEEFTSKFKDDE